MDVGKSKRVPPFSFFGTVRFFPTIKIFSPSIFWCLVTEWMLKNPKGPPPFSVFRQCKTFFLIFFSLRRAPLQFLWCFTADWVFKNPKGSPLSVFRHCETFFENLFFLQRVRLQLRQKCWQFRKCPPFSAPLGPFFWVCNFFEKLFRKIFDFEYCKREYLTLGSLFAIFEPWIWRRLGPVPACFYQNGPY